MAARVIDQNPAHELRGDSEEVASVLPPHVLSNQAKVSLMHEGGGLKYVVGPLALQIRRREASKFGV